MNHEVVTYETGCETHCASGSKLVNYYMCVGGFADGAKFPGRIE